MCTISITSNNISIKADYTTATVNAFRAASGKWRPTTLEWVFSKDNIDVLRKTCLSLFGFFDEEIVPKTAVIIDLDVFEYDNNTLSLGGYRIAERRYRDAAAKLFHDAVVMEGGFSSSGGSVKNPHLGPTKGTKIRVSIPTALANRLIAENNGVSFAEPQAIDKPALILERAALLLRLKAIDELLNS